MPWRASAGAATEQRREHVDADEELGPARDPARAIVREAASRHDHLHMRMVGHGRATGMQHGHDGDRLASHEVGRFRPFPLEQV
jgi:hypothetical protein